MLESSAVTGDSATGLLSIDLDAIAANYRILRDRLGGAVCGACVKADAYGLGLDRVAPVLAGAGCTEFFVSFLEGGVRLRGLLPGARIHVFTGIAGGSPVDFEAHGLIPVLNSLAEIQAWAAHCGETGRRLPADIHVDTGMLRLGLPPDELDRLAADPSPLEAFEVDLVMSHLASADDAEAPQNAEQLAAFRAARDRLPRAGRASLANSSGIFRGTDFHFDVTRPGVAIYGVNPTPDAPSPMRQVVQLKGKILQVRDVDTPQTVGYGATHRIHKPGRIATVGAGYADGYLRSLSNSGTAVAGGKTVPVVGRVSMDLITLDVTDAPADACRPGDYVDLIGPGHDIDALAREAGTIGYEMLTSLGARYRRVYTGGAA